MAVKSWTELQTDLKTLLNDRTDDASIAFAENFNDTINDTAKNATDWKQKFEDNNKEWQEKYNNNDTAWRQKYKELFFSKPIDDDELEETVQAETKKTPMKYEDLFTYK